MNQKRLSIINNKILTTAAHEAWTSRHGPAA
ncbi:SAM-dependent methyltransferase, partial [Bacillus thuringiensis]|nr:SAM-dependent methyltransferase [Bacillus thuringiensis]